MISHHTGLDPLLLDLVRRHVARSFSLCRAAHLHAAIADLERRAIRGVPLFLLAVGRQSRLVESFVTQ